MDAEIPDITTQPADDSILRLDITKEDLHQDSLIGHLVTLNAIESVTDDIIKQSGERAELLAQKLESVERLLRTAKQGLEDERKRTAMHEEKRDQIKSTRTSLHNEYALQNDAKR